MKILVIFLMCFVNISFSEDYISNFQAKVKNLQEMNISQREKFRSYNLDGTFTDNYGNYGKFYAIITSDIKDGKLLRLDSTAENIFSDKEKLYLRAIREKSDIDAGIAYSIIVGGTEKFKPLIGIKCTTSVRYFEDAIFGINKCKLSSKMKRLLKKN